MHHSTATLGTLSFEEVISEAMKNPVIDKPNFCMVSLGGICSMAGNIVTNGLRALIHGKPGEYMFLQTNQRRNLGCMQDLDPILLECNIEY